MKNNFPRENEIKNTLKEKHFKRKPKLKCLKLYKNVVKRGLK